MVAVAPEFAVLSGGARILGAGGGGRLGRGLFVEAAAGPTVPTTILDCPHRVQFFDFFCCCCECNTAFDSSVIDLGQSADDVTCWIFDTNWSAS